MLGRRRRQHRRKEKRKGTGRVLLGWAGTGEKETGRRGEGKGPEGGCRLLEELGFDFSFKNVSPLFYF
jgi:hypothetical protein